MVKKKKGGVGKQRKPKKEKPVKDKHEDVAPVTVEVVAVSVIDVSFSALRTMGPTDVASEEGYQDQVREPRTSLQESVPRVESGLDHRIRVSDEIERMMHRCLKANCYM